MLRPSSPPRRPASRPPRQPVGPQARSDVRSGAQDALSDVKSGAHDVKSVVMRGAKDARNDVRSGRKVARSGSKCSSAAAQRGRTARLLRGHPKGPLSHYEASSKRLAGGRLWRPTERPTLVTRRIPIVTAASAIIIRSGSGCSCRRAIVCATRCPSINPSANPSYASRRQRTA